MEKLLEENSKLLNEKIDQQGEELRKEMEDIRQKQELNDERIKEIIRNEIKKSKEKGEKWKPSQENRNQDKINKN